MTTAKYRIMVTNDDGVSSPGLGILASHLADAGHDVFVAAPLREASGSSAAIGAIMPGDVVVTRSVVLPDAPNIVAFSVDGAPGRCVMAAMRGAFGALPDLVISGINPGANVGKFLQLHSGTLGAALTAGIQGTNAMAVSTDGPAPVHWESAATVAVRLIDYLAGCEAGTTLNLNLPDLALENVKDLRTAPVSQTNAVRIVLSGAAPGDLEIDFERTNNPTPAIDSDLTLIEKGHAVLTRVVPSKDIAPEPFPDDII